jgi:CII-binding regulator of phage lambda lysogenization HflD
MENEKPFEQKVDNDLVVLSDPLSQEIVQGQIESTKRELADFEKARETKVKGKERYIEQAAVHKRAREVVLKGFKKLPTSFDWEYEQDPEYWELQRQMAVWKFESEDKLDESTVARHDKEIEIIDEQIKHCTLKLEKLMKKE